MLRIQLIGSQKEYCIWCLINMKIYETEKTESMFQYKILMERADEKYLYFLMFEVDPTCDCIVIK
jgi:hypothetical protein